MSEENNIEEKPFVNETKSENEYAEYSQNEMEDYLRQMEAEYAEDGEEVEEEEKPFSYFDLLDNPFRIPILDPVDLTLEHLKQISNELGLIKLCWPSIDEIVFEDRTNFPESYLKNNNKEKLLLLYAENFRRQFCYKHPNRKPLFLACDNECGMQKMVCTTIRPTTLPYPEIETWQDCANFVGDHLKYEPLEVPTLIFSVKNWINEYSNR